MTDIERLRITTDFLWQEHYKLNQACFTFRSESPVVPKDAAVVLNKSLFHVLNFFSKRLDERLNYEVSQMKIHQRESLCETILALKNKGADESIIHDLEVVERNWTK